MARKASFLLSALVFLMKSHDAPTAAAIDTLKAFEAAAWHESFTRAAEELCVTQGAVSHQVKALETELAVKLPLGLTGTDG